MRSVSACFLFFLASTAAHSVSVDEQYERMLELIRSSGWQNGCVSAEPLMKSALGTTDRALPLWADLVSLRVRCLEFAGQFGEALVLLQSELSQEPGNTKLRKSLGLLHAQQGRSAEAIPLLEEAIVTHPSIDVFTNLALAKSRVAGPMIDPADQGRRRQLLSEAEHHLNEALEIAPELDRLLIASQKAQIVAKAGRYAEAIHLLENAIANLRQQYAEAVAVQPSLLAESLIALGQIRYAYGERVKGVEEMNSAIRLASDVEYKKHLEAIRDSTIRPYASPEELTRETGIAGTERVRIPSQ